MRFLELQGDKPIYSKGDQSWLFSGRTDAKAETPILWKSPPDMKRDSGRDWGQEEKGTARVRWLDGFTDSMDVK